MSTTVVDRHGGRRPRTIEVRCQRLQRFLRDTATAAGVPRRTALAVRRTSVTVSTTRSRLDRSRSNCCSRRARRSSRLSDFRGGIGACSATSLRRDGAARKQETLRERSRHRQGLYRPVHPDHVADARDGSIAGSSARTVILSNSVGLVGGSRQFALERFLRTVGRVDSRLADLLGGNG